MNDTMRTFGRTIRAEAKRQGLSGYAIAKRSGVPMRTVQRYLAATTDIHAEALERIAAALGLELRPAKRAASKPTTPGKPRRSKKGG